MSVELVQEGLDVWWAAIRISSHLFRYRNNPSQYQILKLTNARSLNSPTNKLHKLLRNPLIVNTQLYSTFKGEQIFRDPSTNNKKSPTIYYRKYTKPLISNGFFRIIGICCNPSMWNSQPLVIFDQSAFLTFHQFHSQKTAHGKKNNLLSAFQ